MKCPGQRCPTTQLVSRPAMPNISTSVQASDTQQLNLCHLKCPGQWCPTTQLMPPEVSRPVIPNNSTYATWSVQASDTQQLNLCHLKCPGQWCPTTQLTIWCHSTSLSPMSSFSLQADYRSLVVLYQDTTIWRIRWKTRTTHNSKDNWQRNCLWNRLTLGLLTDWQPNRT